MGKEVGIREWRIVKFGEKVGGEGFSELGMGLIGE